jgi:putative FmdB family regulatory protein
MPMYSYKCTDCRKTFEIRHGMFFEGQRCIYCYSEDVFRLPNLSERKASPKDSKTPGKVVDKYISDVKEEIKQEKKELREKEL